MPDRAIQMLKGIAQLGLPPERVIAALMNLDALEVFQQICNQQGLSVHYCEMAACIARHSLEIGWSLEELAEAFEFSKQILTYGHTPQMLVSELFSEDAFRRGEAKKMFQKAARIGARLSFSDSDRFNS